MTNEQGKVVMTVSEIAKKYGLTRQAIDKRIKRFGVPVQVYGKTRVIKESDIYLLDLR